MNLISITPPLLLTKSFDYPVIPNAYLEWVEKGNSPKTLEAYAYALTRWLEWCEAKRIDWRIVSEDEILDFRNSLKKSNRSINHEMNLLVRFYDFAARKGIPSPISRLVRPKNQLRLYQGKPVRPIRLVSLADVGVFLRSFPKVRDQLIARVMYLCGLRRAEALGLTRDILKLPTNGAMVEVSVDGKCGVRQVEMSVTLRDELAEYAKTTKGPYIFSHRGRRIHPSTVEKAFAANRRLTGIKIHCHLLRHLYATHRLQTLEAEFKGGSNFNSALKLLQEELGHSSIATTSIYLHLADATEASKSLGTWQTRTMDAIRRKGGGK